MADDADAPHHGLGGRRRIAGNERACGMRTTEGSDFGGKERAVDEGEAGAVAGGRLPVVVGEKERFAA